MDLRVVHLRGFDFCACCILDVLDVLHRGDVPVLHLTHPQKVAVAVSLLMHCRTAEGDPLPVDCLVFPDEAGGGCGATDAQRVRATRRLLQWQPAVWVDALDTDDVWAFVWPCSPAAEEGEHATPLVRACGRWGCPCRTELAAWHWACRECSGPARIPPNARAACKLVQ